MRELNRRIGCGTGANGQGDLSTREWLVGNGLGGYASGTLAGINTRRYHGVLIAALPAPHGRVVMLSHLSDRVRLPGGSAHSLSCEAQARATPHRSPGAMREFRLEGGVPVWRFEAEGFVLEKRIFMINRQNTVLIHYRLLDGPGALHLELRPSLHFRPHEERVNIPLTGPYVLTVFGDRYEVSADGSTLPPLRIQLHAARPTLTVEEDFRHEVHYMSEAERGYESTGSLWSPGYFCTSLQPGGGATLVASTEPWNIVHAMHPEEMLRLDGERRERLLLACQRRVEDDFGRELVLAADQFLITPTTRPEEAARAAAGGDEVGTVIAGYHWFTDWGRDTMISLEGLTLTTGRYREAGCILRTFARYIRNGLIPNLFPEGRSEGLYHTADATLWFFHALDRYFHYTGDRLTRRLILPRLVEIIDHHLRGTRFGIRVDPDDGLLRQGEEGYQLTWMDAKVGDWVVTPRRGKAVELNALWYNALRLLEGWVREEEGDGAESARLLGERAARTREAFNRRFWNPHRNFLFDVVDGEGGDDPVCRPNQILSVSLTFPVLEEECWEPVVEAVRERLVTPVGLRSLEPEAADYKPRYFGDIHARDAAYHQGTVWAWLIGPFIDAWLKVHPEDREGARKFLSGFAAHLNEGGVGSISEIFDADAPFTPRGCIAQAWSVAEVLRCWVKTGGGAEASPTSSIKGEPS